MPLSSALTEQPIKERLSLKIQNRLSVRTKTADGVEEEHTLLLSELDDEPIEELSNLQARGYFTLTLTPTEADAPR